MGKGAVHGTMKISIWRHAYGDLTSGKEETDDRNILGDNNRRSFLMYYVSNAVRIFHLASIPVSYTHLTLPTILLV